jgi:hypothetical protein
MNVPSECIELTCIADGAITNRHALKVTGQSGGLLTVAQATAATDLFLGFARETVATGKTLRVAISGVCEAIANGVITAGTHNLLSVTSDGEVEPYAVGDYPCAKFLGSKKSSATAAANDVISVLIVHGFIDTIV